MEIESEEMFQGLVFASSVESGRALTETWILSIFRLRLSSPVTKLESKPKSSGVRNFPSLSPKMLPFDFFRILKTGPNRTG